MSVEEFSRHIMDHIVEDYGGTTFYEYSPEDIRAIEKLRDEKYSLWEWNFGYSPRYMFEKGIRANGGSLEFHLNVEHGIITELKIYGDFFHRYDIDTIEKALRGVRHEPEAIRERLSRFHLDDYFKNVTAEEFIAGMF